MRHIKLYRINHIASFTKVHETQPVGLKRNNKMSKKKETDFVPAWLNPSNDRTTPYSEEELDVFVKGFIDSHKHQWRDLVSEMGENKAKEKIKDGFRKMDERHISNFDVDEISIN